MVSQKNESAPTVGVLLSGCGVFDGSEIHEAVAVLHAIDQRGATYRCIAPDIELDEIDHIAGKPTGEKRNVLREAARIARGQIDDIAAVSADELDALILPGGFGAAKNLCDFAVNGPSCTAWPSVQQLLEDVKAQGKPIGFCCIAPALAARVFGEQFAPTVTIGSDKETAGAIEKMGARHEQAPVTEIVVDHQQRIVSTPAYMCDARISEVFVGIDSLVNQVLAMIKGHGAS